MMEIGEKYGRIIITELLPTIHGHRMVKCTCDCGSEKIIRAEAILRGRTLSCGCLNRELSLKRFTSHGLSRTKEYQAWLNMKARCYNCKSPYYKNYGSRGIKVCNRWLENFENFFQDLGLAPSNKHELDRINNNGNYDPKNCRWAIQSIQDRNKRSNIWLEHNGKKMIFADWCKLLGISRSMAQFHIRKGRTIEQIINRKKWQHVHD